MQTRLAGRAYLDVVVIAGGGNTSRSQNVGYPAAFPGVLAVGGTDKEGNHSPAAVTGQEIVLAAPCDGISTPWARGERTVSTGTSNSTALVAGAVALLRSKFPEMPAREIVHRLTATAVDKGSQGRDDQTGYGLIDIVAALTADVPPLPPESSHEASMSPGFTAVTPVPAPGSQFPVGLAVLIGLGCLLLTALMVAVMMLWRRRQKKAVTG